VRELFGNNRAGHGFPFLSASYGKENFMKLAAITLGLALAMSSTAVLAQGAGGSGGASAGASAGSTGVSGGASSGTSGTTTGSATGSTGGMNTTINPSGNTLLPGGQSPSQPATGPNSSTGR
jgi:hypothetical protein